MKNTAYYLHHKVKEIIFVSFRHLCTGELEWQQHICCLFNCFVSVEQRLREALFTPHVSSIYLYFIAVTHSLTPVILQIPTLFTLAQDPGALHKFSKVMRTEIFPLSTCLSLLHDGHRS